MTCAIINILVHFLGDPIIKTLVEMFACIGVSFPFVEPPSLTFCSFITSCFILFSNLILLFQIVSHHEDLLSQATGVETLEGNFVQFLIQTGEDKTGEDNHSIYLIIK